VKVPFGKFKGVELADVPDDYLRWLKSLGHLREPLRSAVADEYEFRFSSANPVETLPADVRVMVEEIVASGYRSLAQRHHPDHGGATRAMQLLNDAVAWLRRMVRSS
jgi:hypothetical protein